MEDPGLRPIPEKLRRLRMARESLRDAARRATDRRDQIMPKLREVESVVRDLSSRPRPFLDNEATKADKELKRARGELENLKAMRADAMAQLDEVRADLAPITATCNALEKHLGIERTDEFLPAGFHSVGLGGAS